MIAAGAEPRDGDNRWRLARSKPPDTMKVGLVEIRTLVVIPLMGSLAPCGFPSPADDHLDRALDFNELLIDNVPATFTVRVSGDSMIGIGILPNDLAVINRAITAVDRSIVVALVDGEFTLKRYRSRHGRVWLEAENPKYREMEILDGMTFEIWGVLTAIVRKL